MASPESIAITRDLAVERLLRAASELDDKLKIDPIDFPTHDRDRNYLQAQQLLSLAEFFERVVDAMGGEEFGDETIDELKIIASRRNVDLTGHQRTRAVAVEPSLLKMGAWAKM